MFLIIWGIRLNVSMESTDKIFLLINTEKSPTLKSLCVHRTVYPRSQNLKFYFLVVWLKTNQHSIKLGSFESTTCLIFLQLSEANFRSTSQIFTPTRTGLCLCVQHALVVLKGLFILRYKKTFVYLHLNIHFTYNTYVKQLLAW